MAFDLDGTLYDERDYVSSAYQAYCEMYLPDRLQGPAYRFLVGEYAIGRRRGVIDRLAKKFQIEVDLADFLETLRTVEVEGLSLFEGASDLIRSLLDDGASVSIVSNGNPQQQRNKIHQLNWSDLADRLVVILANELAPKPAPDGLLLAMELVGSSRDQSVLVGDSSSDELCALEAGAAFVHVSELSAE